MLNPTIHPTIAISHDEVADNRVAVHRATADPNAAQTPVTQAWVFVTGKKSGHNKLAIAISANDPATPNSSALSRPFMWRLPYLTGQH